MTKTNLKLGDKVKVTINGQLTGYGIMLEDKDFPHKLEVGNKVVKITKAFGCGKTGIWQFTESFVELR